MKSGWRLLITKTSLNPKNKKTIKEINITDAWLVQSQLALNQYGSAPLYIKE